MGFVWTSAGTGDPELVAIYNEMVTNLGSVYTDLGLDFGGACGLDLSPLSQGDPMIVGDINDARDRADYAYDNICNSDNATHHTSYDNNEKSGYDGTNHVGYDGTDHINYHGTDKGSDEDGHDVIENTTNHTSFHGVDEIDNSTHHNTDNSSEEGNYHVSYNPGFHSPYYASYHATYHGTYDGSEDNRHDATNYVTAHVSNQDTVS